MPNQSGRLHNPKRRFNGKPLPYDFYAAYSGQFVSSVLKAFRLEAEAVVFDPWNGSGTTTRVASQLGFAATGFDLNPAMLVVAQALSIDWNTVERSLPALTQNLLSSTHRKSSGRRLVDNLAFDQEPLELWFEPTTARRLRRLERSIHHLLVKDELGQLMLPNSAGLQNRLSPLAAFFYLGLFETVRLLVKPFTGSNPTWIKTASDEASKLNVDFEVVQNTFENVMTALAAHIRNEDEVNRSQPTNGGNTRNPYLDVADSHALPLPDKSVDAVIGSPPYCTRIDYIVATRPELAVLGYSWQEMDVLRRRMMGTTTVPSAMPEQSPTWGETCLEVLESISTHPSRASRGYYDKWAGQYFDSLHRSLSEIARVLRPTGQCALVVQDSFYKNVHIDLPAITAQMASQCGLSPKGHAPYTVACTMASINPRSKPYRTQSQAVESVLLFQKP